MGVVFGAMFICDSCGLQKFVRHGVSEKQKAGGWNYRDKKIFCPACSREYDEKGKETKERGKENEYRNKYTDKFKI